MVDTEDRLNTIVARLEEGIVIGDTDLEFLAKWNELGIGERLLGEQERSNDVVDLLSTQAQNTLAYAITRSDDNKDYSYKIMGREFIGEPFFGGPGSAAKAGPKILASSGISATTRATMAAEKTGNIFSRHKVRTGLGIAIGSLWALNTQLDGDEDPTTQAIETATAPDSNLIASQPNDYMIVDPRTGQQIPLNEIDPSFNASTGVQNTFGTAGGLSPDLLAYAVASGIDPSQIGLTFGGIEAVNPHFLGEVKVSPTDYPSGIDAYGRAIESPERYVSSREPHGSDFLRKYLPEEDYASGLSAGISMPPGAQLNPAFFGVIEPPTTITRGIPVDTRADRLWQGQRNDRIGEGQTTITKPGTTYATEAAVAADEFGVPIDIIYGVINATSGWNPRAVGNGGTTYGLGQISDKALSRIAAQDPKTALRYVARGLASGYDKYGAWELAALDYHSPEAALLLMNEGVIDKVNKSWLTNSLESSAMSGLGNNIFDFAGLAATPARRSGSGSGRSGPVIPPFQEPDRATLRENARKAVEGIYGRTTSGDELTEFVDQLMAGYREAYEQEVIRIKGGEPVQVDPQARLVDQLRTSGEGEFRVERDQTRSMMDNVGEWARILQEV